ncbi:MAG: hypothetical protein AAF514_21740 [Verrucomicrobiota bacterium]
MPDYQEHEIEAKLSQLTPAAPDPRLWKRLEASLEASPTEVEEPSSKVVPFSSRTLPPWVMKAQLAALWALLAALALVLFWKDDDGASSQNVAKAPVPSMVTPSFPVSGPGTVEERGVVFKGQIPYRKVRLVEKEKGVSKAVNLYLPLTTH